MSAALASFSYFLYNAFITLSYSARAYVSSGIFIVFYVFKSVSSIFFYSSSFAGSKTVL